MAFTLQKFIALRPYLYHLTARQNRAGIERRGQLFSAARILAASGQSGLTSVKRCDHVQVTTPDGPALLRDQAPLHAGNVALDEGFSFADLVAHLNAHVFFWPGTEDGPIPSGRNHFERYAAEDPIIVRVATADMFANATPRFAKFNTGAPRTVNGRKSPRGLGMFYPADAAPFTAGRVIETVFEACVPLPKRHSWLEIARYRNG